MTDDFTAQGDWRAPVGPPTAGATLELRGALTRAEITRSGVFSDPEVLGIDVTVRVEGTPADAARFIAAARSMVHGQVKLYVGPLPVQPPMWTSLDPLTQGLAALVSAFNQAVAEWCESPAMKQLVADYVKVTSALAESSGFKTARAPNTRRVHRPRRRPFGYDE